MHFNKDFHIDAESALPGVAAALTPLMTQGAIISLEGDLGAGKTALARALIRHLSQDENTVVPSPTFTLVQTYETTAGPIWHFDLYRLKSPEEVYEIGWEDALAGNGILLIEWAERIAPLLPPDVTRIRLTPQPDGSRRIQVIA